MQIWLKLLRRSLGAPFVVMAAPIAPWGVLRPVSAMLKMGRKRKSLHALMVRFISSTNASSQVTLEGSEPVSASILEGRAAFQSRLRAAILTTLERGESKVIRGERRVEVRGKNSPTSLENDGSLRGNLDDPVVEEHQDERHDHVGD